MLDRKGAAGAMEAAVGNKKIYRNITRDKSAGEIDRHCRRIGNLYPVEFLAANITKKLGRPRRSYGELQLLRQVSCSVAQADEPRIGIQLGHEHATAGARA